MVMTVECPSCASTFPVDPAKVPEGGVNARCTVCSNVFRVERPRDEAETQATGPAHDEAPEAEDAAGVGSADDPAAAGAGPAGVDDPARAAMPGAPPASQADTESRVGPPEADAVPGDPPGTETEPVEPSGSPADAEQDAGGEEAPEEPDQRTPGEDPPSSDGATAEEMAAAEDWVFETDDDLGAGEAVSAGADASDDDAWQGGVFEVDTGEAEAEADGAAWATPSLPPEVEATGDDAREPEGTGSGSAAPTEGPTAPPEGEIETPGPTPEEPEQPIQGFSFGQRDPADKARRLARVLVSDMIMYNPERHQRALENGTLEEDFEDEIAKSWKEYVEQVGEEMARGTDYWRDALNDILAKGDEVI
jgi:predicted Zn finger-like uncharacterized protein